MISNISNETLEVMKQKSVLSLPDNPSGVGINATDIKHAMTGFVLDSTDSIVAIQRKMIAEINEQLPVNRKSNFYDLRITAGTVTSVRISYVNEKRASGLLHITAVPIRESSYEELTGRFGATKATVNIGNKYLPSGQIAYDYPVLYTVINDVVSIASGTAAARIGINKSSNINRLYIATEFEGVGDDFDLQLTMETGTDYFVQPKYPWEV